METDKATEQEVLHLLELLPDEEEFKTFGINLKAYLNYNFPKKYKHTEQ